MDDRQRIYELSKSMNIPNAEIITALRELGYDVKSHSSTVEKHAVGQLIAHLSKKSGATAEEKPKKTAAKSVSQLPPPPEKKKPAAAKPRVLGRYKKSDLMGPGAEEEAHQGAPAAPGAGVEAPRGPGLPASGPMPLPASQISSTPRHYRPANAAGATAQATEVRPPVTQEPQAQQQPQTQQEAAVAKTVSGEQPAPPQTVPATATKVAPPPAPPQVDFEEPQTEEAVEESEETEPTKGFTGDSWSDSSKYSPRAIRNLDKHFQKKEREEKAAKQQEVEVTEKEVATEADTTAKEPAAKDQETESAPRNKGKRKQHQHDDEEDEDDHQKRGTRPMSPSVPVPTRVAAPSNRATPPRPPKAHRQSPTRHQRTNKEEEKKQTPTVELPKVVRLTTMLTVQELADRMNLPATEVIKGLFMKGVMRTVNQLVEFDVAKDLAVEMEYEVLTEEEAKDPATLTGQKKAEVEDEGNLITRPPVVTIMGHVDHGKTSLLDAIRQTKLLLTAGEAGGITQHIGAYHVEVEHDEGTRQIVFLDTPGHEAFTAMRARGAKATDIAILVVAADDGVMPQTIEAIDHAKAAGVPIIVAVNKIDKAGSDPDRVLSQLMEHDLLPDVYGGETVTCNVSAKNRTGLDDLLEMIILVADLQDLRANPDKLATGVIVEAELSRGKGAVATALVQNGTLREGDYLVCGNIGGRVRALFDDRGNRVKAAGPSMPVEVLGLEHVPAAGEPFEVVDDITQMNKLVDARIDASVSRPGHVTLESLHDMLERGDLKELNVIIKADVQGTAEAIADSVRKLSGEEVHVRILRAASGNISENDVNLAASSEAIIIGFNSQLDPNARSVAEAQGVDVRLYNVIYQITEDLQKAVHGLLEPIKEEVKIGTAEVRQIFKVGKGTIIAGCMVTDGKIQRNSIARIERTGAIIYEGKIDTLKRFKDDVKEVAAGYECGMSFDKFGDLVEGDKINAFIIKETRREA